MLLTHLLLQDHGHQQVAVNALYASESSGTSNLAARSNSQDSLTARGLFSLSVRTQPLQTMQISHCRKPTTCASRIRGIWHAWPGMLALGMLAWAQSMLAIQTVPTEHKLAAKNGSLRSFPLSL